MKDSFQKLLENKNSTLILLPSEPDIDPAAAGLSLYLYLKQQNREVSIACPSPMRVIHNQLIGVDKINNQLGNKNLVVKLSDYNPDNIDTVIWDIVNGEFHLNVVTKNNATPPQKEQVKLDYHGVGSDFIILLGGREAIHFPILTDEHALEAPTGNGDTPKIQIAHIGTEDLQIESRHHIISLAQPASSVSELIAGFLDFSEGNIESDIASNLLTGIYEGSGNFTSNFVSANTFEIVATLMKLGAKLQKQQLPQQAQEPQPLAQRFQQMKVQTMPTGGQFMQGAAPFTNQTPGENTETPEGESVNPPVEWTQTPKIYKGTSVS